MSQIILVDLGAEFWRNWFATKSGIEAYRLTIERVDWYRKECGRVAVCCDGGKLLRHEWFPEYKANRDAKPVDAIDSLVSAQQQMEDWGLPVLHCPGYEADDLIATLVDQAFLDDVKIMSSDKDLYGLLAENVRMVTIKGEVGPAECVEKFGVPPIQIRDYLALCGDAADNVPGCPGVGPGRARDLLKVFGCIDGIKAATDEQLRAVRGVGDKTLTGIRGWDPALAVRLITLLTDAPVDVEGLWLEAA